MGVVYTRIGTPLPGMQAEVHVRFGGPIGQVVMVSRHQNVQELEDIKRRVIEDSSSGKIPVAPAGVFSSVEDAIWLTK